MEPFDSSHTSSYSHSIVTMALSYSLRDIATYLLKNREIFIAICIYHLHRGWPRRNFVKMFDADKTRMIGLPYGEKNYDNYVKLFSSDTGTSRTDGRSGRQTDIQTDRPNCYISIARQSADAR